MTRIQSGLSMCHLQAYPSRMQTLFSWRKDNVPKRCFPDNNLGQEASITLSPQLCAKKPDQFSSMEAFLGLSKQTPTYTFWLFF